MRTYSTIEEVKIYITWAFEFLEKSKKVYTMKEIEELGKKFHKRYYSPFAINDSRNYKNFVKWRSMQYLKHIMYYQGIANTGLVNRKANIDELAEKILMLTDAEGYGEYTKSKVKKGLK